MSLNFLQRLCILLVLTIPSLQLNWQGSGNMSESNMTQIRTLINTYPVTSASDDFDGIAMNISDALNIMWHPAWNVVIVRAVPIYDTILYGYAFRDHWMWINGVPIPGSSAAALSYIIWKDYNCQTWKKVTAIIATATTFTGLQTSPMNNFAFKKIQSDPWADAHAFVTTLEAHAQLSSGAYSVILSQDESATFFGFVCHVSGKYRKSNWIDWVDKTGSYFLFQTR